MEATSQMRYSVLTRTEIQEKMVHELNQISEVFSVSKSDSTVILMSLRWNSDQASDRLGDDKEKFLAKLGLVRLSDPKPNHSSSPDLDGDRLISTPFCSHKFPISTWMAYLTERLLEKNVEAITCLDKDCVASVGPDTVTKLPESMKGMYENYMLASFIQSNKDSMKKCPSGYCDYVIELHDDEDEDRSFDFGVVCLCGYMFCWRCELESHRPLTCENASLWFNNLLDQARSLVWIAANTKPCPQCNSPVGRTDIDSELRLVTCICSCTFCWVCSRSGPEHEGRWNCIGKTVVRQPINQEKADTESALMRYLNLWDSGNKDIEKAKSELRGIEENDIPKLKEACGLGERDIKALREAWTLIVQCRVVMKWICAFEYFVTVNQSAKKAYMNHLREKANETLEKYIETIQGFIHEAISGGGIVSCFPHKVETATETTGNFFHGFIKTLEDGLTDVKVDTYENVQASFWLCGRCAFKNSLSDIMCKACYDPPPPASSSHVATDGNNDGDTNPVAPEEENI